MVDFPIFVIGLVAVSIVMAAVRAISREDAGARRDAADKRNLTRSAS